MRERPRARQPLPALACVLILTGSSGAQEELPQNPTLQDFLRVAEARSPALEASRLHWRAESEAADVAGSFPDPQLSFAWYAREVETRVGPQKQRVSVRQRLPWFGTLGFRAEAAEEGAKALRARYDDRRLALHRDVTLAWLELSWLGQATSLTRENLDLLIHLEEVVRERYRNGRVAHADLIRIQVEMGVLENDLRSLEDRRRPAVARMNTLLHRPPDAPLPPPTDAPEGTEAPDTAGALDTVRRGNLRLHERDLRVAQAEAARRSAGRGRWPDWTVGADWIRTDDALSPGLDESGKDPFVVSVSVDVPLFRGKWDGPARAAQERVAAAEAGRIEEEDELVARAEEVLFEWRDADRRVDLYQGALLPKARESYRALDTAYRTGKGAFLDLIDAQRTLLRFDLERLRALTDRGRSAAKLGYLMGDEAAREETR